MNYQQPSNCFDDYLTNAVFLINKILVLCARFLLEDIINKDGFVKRVWKRVRVINVISLIYCLRFDWYCGVDQTDCRLVEMLADGDPFYLPRNTAITQGPRVEACDKELFYVPLRLAIKIKYWCEQFRRPDNSNVDIWWRKQRILIKSAPQLKVKLPQVMADFTHKHTQKPQTKTITNNATDSLKNE